MPNIPTAPAQQLGEAKALYEKGVWHHMRWHTKKAIEAYDELIERFSSADEPALRELVVKSLYRTATAHAMRRRTKKAIAVWEGLANRYKSVTDPAICGLAARALYMKARSLICGFRGLRTGVRIDCGH